METEEAFGFWDLRIHVVVGKMNNRSVLGGEESRSKSAYPLYFRRD